MPRTGSRWLAGLFLILAATAWFWTARPDLVRVAPADFACWHEGLRNQAGLYADRPDLLPFAQGTASLAAFEAQVTRGRVADGINPAWISVFEAVRTAAGRPADDLARDLYRRVASRERGHVAALFYRADEPPFGGFDGLPEPGGYVYVRRADAPDAAPIQVLRVPVDAESGPVVGCRWYYATWTVPDSYRHPWRDAAAWLALAAVLAFFQPAIGRALAGLRDSPVSDPGLINRRKRSARSALAVTALIAAGLGAAAYVQGVSVIKTFGTYEPLG